LIVDDWRAGGFGLYVHWPYCQAKCPYCDFNSHVTSQIDQTRWKSAYLSEIKRFSEETQGRTLNSVFFGGGTPSLMDVDTVAEIIAAIQSAWPHANDLEITLEANPTSVEADKFRGFRDAGVNRISMGIQSLNDSDLKRLGRLHSATEALAAYDVARGIFERVSFDLIYARQDQSMTDWRTELSTALSLAADHLSLYQLTIEPGTAFGDRYARGGLAGLPSDDLGADLYDLTQELCDTAGLPAYEVSNHAADLGQSRHNLIYWRYGDYVGIGPGAHGRLTLGGVRYATETPLAPLGWLRQVEVTGHGERDRAVLGPTDQAAEFTMMGLRLREGLDMDRYARLAGLPYDETHLDELEGLGLIEVCNNRLSATLAGRRVLNSVIEKLLT